MPGARPSSLRSAVGTRSLLRRAAGLILGFAVLIPAATALDGSRYDPAKPPPAAAAVTDPGR